MVTDTLLRGDPHLASTVAAVLSSGGLPLEGWMRHHGEVLKGDINSLVCLAELDGEIRYLKLYHPKNLLQRVAFRFGLARAVRAFDRASAMRAQGLPVPVPLGCLSLNGNLLLVTEALVDAKDLKSLWLEGLGPHPLAGLMTAAGQLLASMHQAGFSHGDCKWSNLLLGQGRLWLVDLEAVGTAARRRVSRDLARFTVNAEDMCLSMESFEHFVTAYCERASLPRGQFAALVLPELRKLRRRHRKKYGERGAVLL